MILRSRGLSLNALKYIAIIAMLIDHIALAFLEIDGTMFILMDLIGKITGPIMFFAAVEGYHHTRNFSKYLKRLFILAIVSYIPFIFAFSSYFDPLDLNIIFTIFLGLIAIHVRRNVKNVFLKVLILFLMMVFSIFIDYGHLGILIILVMDYFYGDIKKQLFGYLMLIFFDVGLFYYIVSPFWSFVTNGFFNLNDFWSDFMDLGFFIPAVLLYFYNGELGKNSKTSKWFFYIFYPLHLAIIGAVRYAIYVL